MLNKSISLQWFLSLITGLAFICIFYILIKDSTFINDILSGNFFQSYENGMIYLLPAILLVPINWFFEYKKWDVQDTDQKVHFWDKVTGILTGSAVAAISPGRTGEYFGRLLVVSQSERYNTIYYGITAGASQFIINIFIGLLAYGLLVVSGTLSTVYLQVFLAAGGATICFAILLLFFHPVIFKRLFLKVTHPVLTGLHRINFGDKKLMLSVLFYSLARYGVYVLQFLLLMAVFQTSIPFWVLVAGMASVFFLQSFIPVLGILEIGLKGSIAIFVFSMFPNEQQFILLAFTVMWGINVILPGICGALFFLGFQFKKDV